MPSPSRGAATPDRPAVALATVVALAALAALGCDDATPTVDPPELDAFVDAGDATPDADRARVPPGTATWLVGVGPRGYVDGVGEGARFHSVACLARRGRTLYLSDTGNATLRALDLDTREVTLFAGRPGERATLDGPLDLARFRAPGGCALVGDALYLGDGPTLRHIDLAAPDPVVTTLAGAPHQPELRDGVGRAARFGARIRAIAPAPDGGLYLTDDTKAAIRHYQPATGAVTTVDRLSFIGDVAVDPRDGALLITTVVDGEHLYRLALDGALDQLAQISPPPDSDFDYAIDPLHGAQLGLALDGLTLYLASSDSTLHRYALDTGALTPVFARDHDTPHAAAGAFPASGAPPHLDAGDRALYLTGTSADYRFEWTTGSAPLTGGDSIDRLDLDTFDLTPLAGPIESVGDRDGDDPRFRGIGDITHDGARWLVSDIGNHAIRAIEPDGNTSTLFVGRSEPSPGLLPHDIAHDGARLYLTDYFGGAVHALEDGALIPLTDALRYPRGLDVGPDGALYVTDDEGVYRLDLDGTLIPLVPPYSLSFNLDIAVDRDGRVFVTDRNHALLYQIVAGDAVLIAGHRDEHTHRDGPLEDARFVRPDGLVVAPDGALLVTDGGTIRRVDLAAGRVGTWLGRPGLAGNFPTGTRLPLRDATLDRASAIALHGDTVAIAIGGGVVIVQLDQRMPGED